MGIRCSLWASGVLCGHQVFTENIIFIFDKYSKARVAWVRGDREFA